MYVRKMKNILLMSVFFFYGIIGIASDAVFLIGNSADTQIKWRGADFIVFDNLNFFDKSGFSQKARKVKVDKSNKWDKIVNVWSDAEELPFRKEVAVSADGKEIELNIRTDLPAYCQKPETSLLSYDFNIPMNLVKGMKYIGKSGRTGRPKQVTGVIGEGKLSFQTRYLCLEGNGKKIVIDFNPEGVNSWSDYGPNDIIGLWRVRQTADYLKCGIKIRNAEYGGALSGKVRIFEGNMSDYLKRHAHEKYKYFSELPVEKQFCFGAKKHGNAYTDAGLKKYSSGSGFGWADPQNMKILSARNSGSVYSAAVGSDKNTFRCDLLRPGLYILSMRCAAYKNPQGAFSLSSNGKQIIDELAIEPYTLKNICWSQWIEDGKLELNFSGKDFTISVLSAQLLQHRLEDFKFKRGFWIVDGYEPHPINTNANFDVPVEYVTAVTSIALPRKPITDPVKTPIIPAGATCLPNQSAPEIAWRYNSVIGSIGPGNNGAFTEFDTAEKIERRLKKVKAQKIDCIMLNGLLSRLTFPSQLKRVEDNVKMIVDKGHALGIKILDHQDLTLLWNRGSGFRVMTEKIGMTQRTIDGNFPTRGFCLTNKNFNKWYYPWMVDYICNTNIDGLMIDEACYHGKSFCGCVNCRKKFTADTGLILPFDETSPLLYNEKSELWKAWLAWRIKATGDWSVELRRKIMPKKPYFSLLRYTTHYGYRSTFASLSHGATLSSAARSCDFLGTEIMSRNVMASYRAVFAMRKAKNALHKAFNSPIFGLVYSLGNADQAYFGWAMNNMNGQVTWIIRKKTEYPFTLFKENMDLNLAEPDSELAVMYSHQGRDWAKYMSVIPDQLGMSQALTDRHIMHDFFMEHSLKFDFLKKYRAVILNCCCCLSDEQIKELRTYVEHGGTLYMTATTALLDQLGNDHKTWPLEQLAGVKIRGKRVSFIKKSLLRYPGEKAIKYPKNVMQIALVKNNPPKVIAEVVNEQGKVIQPLAVEKKLGKGKVIYCAAALSSVNYESETTYGRKWTYSKNKEIDTFNNKMIDQVIGKKPLRFKVVQTPERILMSVYRQTKDNKAKTLVHLLNAAGSFMELGAIIPKVPPLNPVWPEIKKDIIFDISLPNLKKAYLVSPDQKGQKKVSFKKIAGYGYRVTVPKEKLKCYSIVYLEY
jgi:hypothetical protein